MKKPEPLVKQPILTDLCKLNFNPQMKLSWTSIKISIAGAKLSHLVQKDRIWDHGSMAEQARIIFYLVHKAKAGGNIESLKKQCTISCFEKLKREIEAIDKQEKLMINSPVIKGLAILEVHEGGNNKPDMFWALIKYAVQEIPDGEEISTPHNEFIAKWCFVRQGDWWLLNEIKR